MLLRRGHRRWTALLAALADLGAADGVVTTSFAALLIAVAHGTHRTIGASHTTFGVALLTESPCARRVTRAGDPSAARVSQRSPAQMGETSTPPALWTDESGDPPYACPDAGRRASADIVAVWTRMSRDRWFRWHRRRSRRSSCVRRDGVRVRARATRRSLRRSRATMSSCRRLRVPPPWRDHAPQRALLRHRSQQQRDAAMRASGHSTHFQGETFALDGSGTLRCGHRDGRDRLRRRRTDGAAERRVGGGRTRSRPARALCISSAARRPTRCWRRSRASADRAQTSLARRREKLRRPFRREERGG